MSEYLKGMKRRMVVCAGRITPGRDETPIDWQRIPLGILGRADAGPRQAWVPDEHGRWSSKPGYSKLYFSFNLHAGQIRLYNTHASRMLNVSTVQYIRQPPYQPGGFYMPFGCAWLVRGPGVLRSYFNLKAEHQAEIREHIADEFGDGAFDTHVDRGKLNVFPLCDGPEEWARRFHDAGAHEIDAAKLSYEMFPVFARMRWG